MSSSNKTSSLALFFCLNLLFFSLVAAHQPAPCVPAPVVPAPVVSPPAVPTPSSMPPTSGPGCSPANVGVCASLLGGLVNITVGQNLSPCCSLIQGLVDLEAAVCICTALKVSALGLIKVDLTVDVKLVLNGCGKTTPPGFQCRVV